MFFYEYWCEQYDPQPVGHVELNTEHVAQRSMVVVLFKLFAASMMAAGLFWLPFHFLPLTGSPYYNYYWLYVMHDNKCYIDVD